jgi:PAS domain S-box-containing protein
MDTTKILIVEDENIVALDIKNRLTKLGYLVAGRAVSGPEAIALAAESQPDLILMDIRLKGDMDGITAAEQIRDSWDIPVIFLTAYSDETTLQRAKITQPYGYLLKPFEDRDLHTTIAMALYRHKIERELRESRQWLATTLRSIGDGVIATDRHSRIKFMNPVAEALTGWSQAEALGQPYELVFNIINRKTRQPVVSPINLALQQNRVVELEDNTLLIAKNGTEIPIDDSAAPIRDDQGRIDGAVLVFRDITERKRAEEKLRQFMQEVQIQNAELNAFAHTAAHDLKTPLNPVIGFAEILVQNHTTMSEAEVVEFLQAIARNARKMSNVIDELLLLAHVRQAEVKVKPLQMGPVVTQVMQRLDYMLEEYQAEVILPPSWPAALGYAAWVEEIWANYISTGLNYGGRPPRLELGAAAQADGQVRFWVRDNGAGLTSAAQARLFTPFTQLNQIQMDGHGLGLSIVRRIVEKLEGQVGVESDGLAGSGALFYFTLPGAAVEPAHHPANGYSQRLRE